MEYSMRRRLSLDMKTNVAATGTAVVERELKGISSGVTAALQPACAKVFRAKLEACQAKCNCLTK